jgi:hypothetical protein
MPNRKCHLSANDDNLLKTLCENNAEQILQNLARYNIRFPSSSGTTTPESIYNWLLTDEQLMRIGLQNLPYYLNHNTPELDNNMADLARNANLKNDGNVIQDIGNVLLGVLTGTGNNDAAYTPPPPPPPQKPNSTVIYSAIGLVILGAIIAIFIFRSK